MIEQFSAYFANLGIPPIVAGMMIGTVFGFLLRGILKPAAPAAAVADKPGAIMRTQPTAAAIQSYELSHLKLMPSVEADIHEALRRGSKIEAIKLLREATGLGLKESKDIIDAVAR